MTIRLDTGETFEARVITRSLRDPEALLMEIRDERPLSRIAAEFEGAKRIERDAGGGLTEVMLGFERLTALVRDGEAVRLMLRLSARAAQEEQAQEEEEEEGGA